MTDIQKLVSDIISKQTCKFWGYLNPDEISKLYAHCGDIVIVGGIPDVEKEVDGQKIIEEGTATIGKIEVKNKDELVFIYGTWNLIPYEYRHIFKYQDNDNSAMKDSVDILPND